MNTINLSYDKKHDIFYARFPFTGHSYGDEDEDGLITYRNIENDSVTGLAIYSFKERLNAGNIYLDQLPIPLDAVLVNEFFRQKGECKNGKL